MHRTILERAWSEERQSMTEAFDGDTVDASLLLLSELGFLEPQDPRFLGTLAAIEQEQIFRILSFFVAGVLMIGGSYLYHRVETRIQEEEADSEDDEASPSTGDGRVKA